MLAAYGCSPNGGSKAGKVGQALVAPCWVDRHTYADDGHQGQGARPALDAGGHGYLGDVLRAESESQAAAPRYCHDDGAEWAASLMLMGMANLQTG